MQTRLIAILVRLVLGQHQLAVTGAQQEVDDRRVIIEQRHVQDRSAGLRLTKITMTQLHAAFLSHSHARTLHRYLLA